jgi:alpha-glucosidase
VDIIKGLPSVWDETIVLPPSEIGELAMFARRSGTTWFVAAMNGLAERTVKVDLRFLGRGRYHALVARDKPDEAAAVEIWTTEVTRSGALVASMRAGGGFVARLTP